MVCFPPTTSKILDVKLLKKNKTASPKMAFMPLDR
jgi:hypothetical protein